VLVESVSVRGVRNLAAAEIGLGPGVNLVWGPNGAGKTNVLEALYLGLAGRSCRTNDDREMITFGESLARSEVTLAHEEATTGRTERLEFLCAVTRSDGRRHLVDGATAGPAAATRRPALAVFMPDRLALVKGPPSARRTHLDGFCAALWPARGEQRRRYSRALAQRNALLGRIRAGAAGPASLDAWDAELASAGVELIATRTAAVDRLAEPFAQSATALGIEGGVRARYRPRSEAGDPEQLAAELAERRDGDIARGYTGWGPHLDELALEVGERSMRRYASQGQQRIALLSLLFAERQVLLDDGRPPPLMLLDDVTSELDLDRRRLLVDHLAGGGGQALITATERDHLPSHEPRTEIALRRGAVIGDATAGEEAA
jgi:DNA replication and repair protein RecF